MRTTMQIVAPKNTKIGDSVISYLNNKQKVNHMVVPVFLGGYGRHCHGCSQKPERKRLPFEDEQLKYEFPCKNENVRLFCSKLRGRGRFGIHKLLKILVKNEKALQDVCPEITAWLSTHGGGSRLIAVYFEGKHGEVWLSPWTSNIQHWLELESAKNNGAVPAELRLLQKLQDLAEFEFDGPKEAFPLVRDEVANFINGKVKIWV